MATAIKTITREVGARTVCIKADIKDMTMSLRTEMGTGHIKHRGKRYTIEVSNAFSAVLVQGLADESQGRANAPVAHLRVHRGVANARRVREPHRAH